MKIRSEGQRGKDREGREVYTDRSTEEYLTYSCSFHSAVRTSAALR
jgi:hypothetical protein